MIYRILLLTALLTACGSDSSGSGADSAPTVSLAELSAWSGPCNITTKVCPIYIKAALSDATAAPEQWAIMLMISTDVAPDSCDISGVQMAQGTATFGPLPSGINYAMRACAWNKTSDTFDEGKTDIVRVPIVL